MRPKFFVPALLAVVALSACSGGGGGNAGGGGASTTAANGGPALVNLTAEVGAANTGFSEKTATVPADTAFTIHFVNNDAGLPHNVQIFKGNDTSVAPMWAPEGQGIITGVAEVDYPVPALAAGTYTYTCVLHPTTMVGTLTAG